MESATPNATRSLPRLPVELIEHIFSSTDDVKTLAPICSVSKLGQRVATPLLYRTLGVAGTDPDVDGESAARSLQLQCRTLIENRELAKHVREIRQHISKHFFKEEQHDMSVFRQKQVYTVLKGTGLPSSIIDLLVDSIGDGFAQTDEVCFMLFLVLCPQITTLRLEGELRSLHKMGYFIMLMDEFRVSRDESGSQARDEASGYHTIREIDLTNLAAGELGWIGFDDILPLLSFPKLEKLTSDSFHARDYVPFAGDAPSMNSAVKTIQIEGCWGASEDLAYLLYNCPNVESLSIQWGTREDNYRRFDWRDIGESIRTHTTKLKHLKFDHYPDLDPSDHETEDMMDMMADDYMKRAHLPGLGGLKDLESLETLTLSDIALRGTHNDDQFDPDGVIDYAHRWDDSDDDEEGSNAGPTVEKHTLEQLLPDSLRELTVLCEGLRFSREDQTLLSDPRPATLQNLTIKTCLKHHWISTRDGEGRTCRTGGSITAEEPRARRAEQTQAAPRPAAEDHNDDDPNFEELIPPEALAKISRMPIEARRALFEQHTADIPQDLPPELADLMREPLRILFQL